MESDAFLSSAIVVIGYSLKNDDSWDKLPYEEKQRREKLIEDLINEAAELRRNGR